MKKLVSMGALGILILTLTNGCMGFGMYESPKILEKGESKIGVGTPFFLGFQQSGRNISTP